MAFKDYRIARESTKYVPSRSVDFSFHLATKVKLIVSLQDIETTKEKLQDRDTLVAQKHSITR